MKLKTLLCEAYEVGTSRKIWHGCFVNLVIADMVPRNVNNDQSSVSMYQRQYFTLPQLMRDI